MKNNGSHNFIIDFVYKFKTLSFSLFDMNALSQHTQYRNIIHIIVKFDFEMQVFSTTEARQHQHFNFLNAKRH